MLTIVESIVIMQILQESPNSRLLCYAIRHMTGEIQSGQMTGEIQSGQMTGEIQSGQMKGETQSGQAQIHDGYPGKPNAILPNRYCITINSINILRNVIYNQSKL